MKFPFSAAALFLFISTAFALEPWADTKLPVREGVELWLDSASQRAARDARKLPAPGGPLDVWFDGSGRGRHVSQRVADSQPRWQQTPGGAFAHFDGKDDWLGATNLGTTLSSTTVFLVAAPRLNVGFFRAFLSWSETSRNDYQTGLNLDLGGAATPTFTMLNAEGAGFPGERNLLKTQLDFGTFHVFAFTAEPGDGGARLFLDGTPQGRRGCKAVPFRMEDLAIGARLYSNSADPVAAQSPLHGDIAEVLVYNRALSDAERAQVEHYLIAKHSGLKSTSADGGKPLIPVKNPPLVQMLVPGFAVRELPVELTNMVCLRYRADGKLVAGAYNGKVWLLSDSNGDGLEDRADLYWQSEDLKGVIGMCVTPAGDPRGDGVFVATKERILFIPDKNGDGRGDEQRVVATGWPKQVIGSGGGGIVEALGLTMDKDGNLYFGLGCDAFANAYVIDEKTGKSNYKVSSERGTIQRVSADFSKRETICTGIRYPVGAAFNALGDLFVTDQEGATWLPNGNPLDELLHLQPGRHYGFPPRHPKHLPGVIDEPSVFDYGPQHQSTCGMLFNHGRASFGPAWWAGDALVAGEARGKLWRTKLVKTPAGYLAQNQLIACLAMLAVDVALSPRGDLVVACHSGDPDWGTGPEGAGKIFKIAQTDKAAPQPVLTWNASPTELRVGFDRELDPTKLKDLAKRTGITQGLYVAAGDRFESIRPGYQAVKDQMAAPRYDVPVLGASLSADRRELIFSTAPRPAAVNYAISMPDLFGAAPPAGALPRVPDIDVACDLSGLEAEWTGPEGESWRGWLPHLDLAVSRAFTAPSAAHARLFELLGKPGQLRLRGQLDLWEMLQPAVQPGSKLDYERPAETVTVNFESNQPFTASAGKSKANATGREVWTEQRESQRGEWLPFEFALATGKGEPQFTATWSTADDPRPRAFPLRRVLVPWAQPKTEPAKLITEREIPELKGGNWLRGQRLFFGKSTCGVCHTIGGTGGHVGPDLSNLVHRDYASVVRDIREPSAALNPDHIAYSIEPNEGPAFAGLLLGEEKGELRLADATGAVRTVKRSALKSMQALPVSLMPPGLLEVLSAAEQRDLLTFLLTPALEPAPIEAPNPPPPRKRAEVAALLKNLVPPAVLAKPLRIVLCAGPKDHGPGEHDYPLWLKRWSRLLAMAEGVEVSTAMVWPGAEQMQTADLIAFFSNNPGWNAERAKELDAFFARGKGVAYFHFAVDGHNDAALLADRIGLAVSKSACKFRHGPVDFVLHPHPLLVGLPPLHLIDETYWAMIGDKERVQLIAEAVEDGEPRPQLWTREQDAGRVFVSIPGHYNWTFDDPFFRALAFRGLCWAAGQPIDRLAELIPIGARIGD